MATGAPVAGWRALGDLFLASEPPRRAEAALAYQNAVDLNDPWSMIRLARVKLAADASPEGFAQAKELLEKAIEAGAPAEASRELGDFYRFVEGANRDLAKAEAAYKKAIDLGDTGAMIALSQMYASSGEDAQFTRALKLLNSAVAAGDVADGSMALGALYMTENAAYRDPAKAATAYQAAADAGNSWARIALAEMLAKGEGVGRDIDRARALLQEAIDAGLVARASRALGDVYLSAEGPERKPALAAEAYARAAGLGDPWAMIALGRMLAEGDGVPVDLAKARTQFENAGAVGEQKESTRGLADLYRNPQAPFRDPAKAAALYKQLAEANDTWAMISLARMLAQGDGIARSFDEARDLLEKATSLGNDAAARSLGDLYRSAEGADRDFAKAEAAYRAAVEKGNSDAMMSLAEMYAKGEGVPASFDGARDLLRKAIKAGNVREASRALGDLYAATGPDHNPAEAAKAYQVAVDNGDPWAMITLGRMLGDGDGIKADRARAETLLNQAMEAGQVRDAARTLGDLLARADGGSRDPARAVDAYEKAADLGDPWAMIALGGLLARGDGTAADPGKAADLFTRAASAGAGAAAWRALGDLYRENPALANPGQAAAAYQKAVDLGDTSAMISLAELISSGSRQPADFDRARGLLETAVSAGAIGEGSRRLGELYLKAPGGIRDAEKARQAYRAAADAGDTWAMIALANMYRRGDGVPVDLERTEALLSEATAGGNIETGAQLLGDLSLERNDIYKARANYELAARAGSDEAALSLALLIFDKFTDSASRATAAEALHTAAAALGATKTANAVMRLPSRSLVVAVQQMLQPFGYRGRADGIHGATTEEAIASFCRSHSIADCDGTFVSFDFLVALLSMPAGPSSTGSPGGLIPVAGD